MSGKRSLVAGSNTTNDDRIRYFIVSPGRTGSTLLAWTLARAGAEFGLHVPERWDPGAGELEHPRLIKAARAFGASHQLSPDKPRHVVRRLPWTWFRHAAKQGLRDVLAKARFLKAEDLDLAVQPAVKLGYVPRIILNFRRFEPHAIGRFQRQTYASVDWFEAYYLRVCRNALLQVELYGGCCIDYDDLTNPDAQAWADALASITGFRAEDLARFRAQAMGGKAARSGGARQALLSQEAERVYQQMRRLADRPIPPGPQARLEREASDSHRTWDRSLGDSRER